jgi:hypothetical protein
MMPRNYDLPLVCDTQGLVASAQNNQMTPIRISGSSRVIIVNHTSSMIPRCLTQIALRRDLKKYCASLAALQLQLESVSGLTRKQSLARHYYE